MNACISVEGREGVEEERGLRSGEGNEGKGEFGVCREEEGKTVREEDDLKTRRDRIEERAESKADGFVNQSLTYSS